MYVEGVSGCILALLSTVSFIHQCYNTNTVPAAHPHNYTKTSGGKRKKRTLAGKEMATPGVPSFVCSLACSLSLPVGKGGKGGNESAGGLG